MTSMKAFATFVIFVIFVVFVGAQAPAYKVPRTPDGQPDLQGFWSNATYTPLERPDNVTKEFYTPAEAVAAEKAAAARESAETEPGTVADVHYDFTQFGLDRSQATLARTLRTSLIVDPKNGKLPAISEEGRGFWLHEPKTRSGSGAVGTRRRAISSTIAASSWPARGRR